MSNKTNYDIMWYDCTENEVPCSGYVVTKFDNSIPNDSKMFKIILDSDGNYKWKPYVYKDYPYAYYFTGIRLALAILKVLIYKE